MGDFDNKVAIVTGGSSGIGKAMRDMLGVEFRVPFEEGIARFV